jgi:hypothetical protein
MRTLKAKSGTAQSSNASATEYRGKQTKTGNSSGFRFEGALFKSHPEFNGDVTAYVIAPGRLLVTADAPFREKGDPAMEAFLAFLSQDIANAPNQITPLDASLGRRIDVLVEGVNVSSDEALGAEVIL